MPKHYGGPEKTEWTYLVDIADLSSGPKTFKFKADERERTDLARRFGIVSIERAEASITLQKVGGGMVHAIGSVRADVTQACTISLAPLPTHVEDDFEGWFSDKAEAAVSFAKARTEREAKKGQSEIEILEESVDPEPIVAGKVDIGELATQYLSLSLEPYPHAEGVAHVYSAEPPDSGKEGAEIRKSPFEALKDWKEKR